MASPARIESVVATFSLGHRVDLARFAALNPGVKYTARPYFTVASWRAGPGQAAVFPSGKVVVTGAKTAEDVEVVRRIVIDMTAPCAARALEGGDEPVEALGFDIDLDDEDE